jgi:hypothetical protein
MLAVCLKEVLQILGEEYCMNIKKMTVKISLYCLNILREMENKIFASTQKKT